MRPLKIAIPSVAAVASVVALCDLPEAEAGLAACPSCNIVWITMDTTRADRMGFLGATRGLTPNLDKLARRGTVFRNAYSQAPATLLSVSSFLSGRYRHNNGIDFDLEETARYHALSPEVTTFAEALGQAGYRRVGINANPVISDGKGYTFGFSQGFERWTFAEDPQVASGGVAAMTELAAGGKPFFLYLHFMGPHASNPRLPGFEERRGHFDSAIVDATQPLYEEILNGRRAASAADIDTIRALYDDAVWTGDQQIGQVLDAVSRAPQSGRTLVVFTSDHGETLGEPGYAFPRLGHGQALSEELLRVPLVVSGPGAPAGADTRIAELVDLAPTLATLVGVPVQPAWRWDGQALLGSADVPGSAISERAIWPARQVSARTPTAAAVRSLGQGWQRLYDLRSDPHQQKPLVPTPELQALLGDLERYVSTAKAPSAAGSQTQASPEELELLRSLGYVE